MFASQDTQVHFHLRGMPLPRPLNARCAAPGGKPCWGACGCSLGSFLIVSSTLNIKQLASTAAWIAFIFTRLGSQTKASMLSRTPSCSKSTPAQMLPLRCSTRNRLRMSVASKPALSQSWRGMISRAFANDFIMACCLCGIFLSAYLCRNAEISIYVQSLANFGVTDEPSSPHKRLHQRRCYCCG